MSDMWKRWTIAGAVLALAAGAACSAQTYKVVGEYKLPGASAGTVAVDSESRHAFVAGSEGVTVVNADTGAAVGTVALKGASDVLLVPVMNGEEPAASTMGFASAPGHVAAFSLADMKVTATAKTGAGTSSLCYDEDAKTVEAVDPAGVLTTINAETGKAEHSAKIATGAGSIACGTLAHVYVADTAANVVHVLNHETGMNEGDYPIMTGSKPTGMTLDTKGRRLFVSCEDGTIEVIDTDSGFTFIELKGGAGISHATFAWTPQGKGQWKAAAFFVGNDGSLIGVRMMAYINYVIGGKYSLNPGLTGIGYDAKTHHLLVSAVRNGAPVLDVVGY